MKQTITKSQADDLGHWMKLAVGAAVISMTTSISTHHVAAVSPHHKVTPAELSHMFEREREVLHQHANLGRVRYATVSGNNM